MPPAEAAPIAASGKALVILVHGLGRRGRSMRRLEQALRDHGFATRTWDYPRALPLGELIARFRRYLDQLTATQPVHLVGHSLGGILIRGALQRRSSFPLARIVMIAPPNRGVGLIDRIGFLGLAERLYGRPVRDLASDGRRVSAYGVPDTEIGIIAGTQRFHLLNPTAYFSAVFGADVPHDGTIEVERTKLKGMADFVTVPASHTWMCADPEVIRQTTLFLQRGYFDHGREKGAEAAATDADQAALGG